VKGQTSIPGESLRPPDPSQNTCDWCTAPAVGSRPLLARVKGKRNGRVQTGMHVYFCSRHQHTAEEATAEPVRTKRAA
jgi:hypothetical protein